MDDPYPRDGQYYQPVVPDDTKNANTEEKRKAEEAMPFIAGVLGWFDTTVEATDSIQLAMQLAEQYNCSVEDTAVALDICRRYLEAKKGELQSLAMTLEK